MSSQANAIPVGLEGYVPFETLFINLFTHTTHHPSSYQDHAIQSRRASWDQRQEPVYSDVPQLRLPEHIPEMRSESYYRPVWTAQPCLLNAARPIRKVSVSDRRVTRDISKRSEEEVKKLGSPAPSRVVTPV